MPLKLTHAPITFAAGRAVEMPPGATPPESAMVEKVLHKQTDGTAVEWLGKRKPHDWPNAKPKHGIPAPELALPTSTTAKPELGLAALGNLKTSVEFVSHSTRSPACVSAGRPSSSAASSSSAVETPQHNAPEP